MAGFALQARLQVRQAQSLVLTPQLQQAIKLLQLSNLELDAYLSEELLSNPLLERDDSAGRPADALAALDWQSERRTPAAAAFDGDPIAALGAAEPSLHDHLRAQIALAVRDPLARLIAQHVVDLVDDAGYIRSGLDELAEQLAVGGADVAAALAAVQACEPTGVGARSLAECLTLQLRERDRLDPAMRALLDRLDWLAAGDFARLRRHCGQGEADFADMLAELRALNPKPGLAFGATRAETRVPDLILARAGTGWRVTINRETLPRLRLNRNYRASLGRVPGATERGYLGSCASSANWLIRSLDQRVATMVKVGEAIVARQAAFFEHGLRHMRPLTLRDIADSVGVHESTVSRVTSRKHIATPRGTFDLKYFFSTAIAASDGGDEQSSEAVRFRIRELVAREEPARVLSDDHIVTLLRGDGIEIARRTVAKYRDLMRIPSSVQRRREKNMIVA